MIEQVMYLVIGFFAAGFVALLFVPLVHNRAVRLTTRRIDAATPMALSQINADRDQIRAQCAMSIRRLEVTVEQLKNKVAAYMAEIAKKTDVIRELKGEFDKKDEQVIALRGDEKTLRNELRAAKERCEVQSNAVEEAERVQSSAAVKLRKLFADLAYKNRLLDERQREIEGLHQEICEAREINNDLNHRLLSTRSRGRQMADKLSTEVERLQTELSAAVAARSHLKQQMVAMQRETERHWSPERFDKSRR